MSRDRRQTSLRAIAVLVLVTALPLTPTNVAGLAQSTSPQAAVDNEPLKPTVNIVSPIDDSVIESDTVDVTVNYRASLVGSLLLGVSRLELRISGTPVAVINYPRPARGGQVTFHDVDVSDLKALPAVQLTVRAWQGPVLLNLRADSAPVDMIFDQGVAQLRELESASDTRADFEFDGGIPTLVDVDVPVTAELADDPVAAVLDVLDRYRDLYSLDDPAENLHLASATTMDDGATVLKFGQEAKGIPIFGAEIIASVTDGRFTGTIGHYLGEVPSQIPTPGVSADEAEAAAIDSTEAGKAEVVDEPRLVWFAPELVGETGPVRLAWDVTTRDAPEREAPGAGVSRVLVATDDRSVLYALPTEDRHQRDGEDFDITRDDGGDRLDLCYAFDDLDEQYDHNGPIASSPVPDATDAWNHLHTVFVWFFDNFAMESWDDAGDDIEVTVNENSLIGDGEAVYKGGICEILAFSDRMTTLDILAHEYTHGIDDHARDLNGSGESGALNESYPDVFASLIELDRRGTDGNWTIGEDSRVGPIRDLSNPPRFDDPDRFSEFVRTSADKGGVHTNNGITNFAAYLLAQGGTHPDTGIVVDGIGRPKLARLWFDVLMWRLPSNARMITARNATVQRARELAEAGLSGFTQNDVCQVVNAFAAVELGVPDRDCDGMDDTADNDDDGDRVDDARDNCPITPNPGQTDIDGDGRGDACDPDIDGDGVPNTNDNCRFTQNVTQADFNADRIGDACQDVDRDGLTDAEELRVTITDPTDPDTDGDGLRDGEDPVPSSPDIDQDGVNDPEELDQGTDPRNPDTDGDGVDDGADNSPTVFNPDQSDTDGDGVGDASDNCGNEPNPDQADRDGDGQGNECDDDLDGDGVDNDVDNCRDTPNPHQIDIDGDGQGLECDTREAEHFNGDARNSILTGVRFDEFGRARIPLNICLELCPNWLPAATTTRVDVAVFKSIESGPIPIHAYAVDSLGDGASGKRNVDLATLQFQPAADTRYVKPTGKEFSGRNYFLELRTQPEFAGLTLQTNLYLASAYDGAPPPPRVGEEIALGTHG